MIVNIKYAYFIDTSYLLERYAIGFDAALLLSKLENWKRDELGAG